MGAFGYFAGHALAMLIGINPNLPIVSQPGSGRFMMALMLIFGLSFIASWIGAYCIIVLYFSARTKLTPNEVKGALFKGRYPDKWLVGKSSAAV